MRWALLLLLCCGSSAMGDDDLTRTRERLAALDRQRAEMFAQASQAVVCIFAEPAAEGGGSGVLIDPRGYGLTNFHVVQEFVESRQGFGGLNDGKLYRLRVLGIDAGGDIALFKLEGRDTFPFMPLADSDALRNGQDVAALGNPFILAEDFQPTITYGVISGLHRYQEGQGNLLEYADCIQVSTSINPGNSGGPLIDMQGRLIGINGRASFEERGRVNVGLGYAVTINQIRRFLPALRAGHCVEHGTLGLSVREINGKLVVATIQQLSPSEKAGLELGDELVTFDGRTLRTANEFNNAVAILPANWPVDVVVKRGDERIERTVRLERLALPLGKKFVVDLEDNHTELRSLLGEARAIWNLSVDTPVCWRVTEQDWCSQPELAVPTGVDDEAARIEWEFQQIAAPFLTEPALDVSWEWTGSDRVRGHIAAVIRHAPDDGPKVTWRIRYDDAQLLDVRFEYDKERVVVWHANDVKAFEAGHWPARWTRSKGDDPEVFEVSAFTQQVAP